MKTLVAALLAAIAIPAAAQNALVGSWTLVSNTTDPAGKKSPTLGMDPRGTLIFAPDGRYSFIMARAGLPRFVGNNRERGTDDENRAVVTGTFAHAGRYSVDERGGTFSWQVEASTFPNWENTVQRRSFKIVGDELHYTSPSASNAPGTALQAVWRRAK